LALINILNINNHLRLGVLDFAAFSSQESGTAKRELEKKGSLFLLKNLFPASELAVSYTPENKPYLQGFSEHISISHSHDKLVILVNTRESTGVDVELIREKVINIKHKFLCEEEQVYAGNNVEALTILWAAKEAIYKAYGLKGVDFAEDIFIETATLGSDYFFGTLKSGGSEKRYRMAHQKLDNYILVYILNEV
jgi:4'-phosphopantetheinyl transferase